MDRIIIGKKITDVLIDDSFHLLQNRALTLTLTCTHTHPHLRADTRPVASRVDSLEYPCVTINKYHEHQSPLVKCMNLINFSILYFL
jgi:hypothetical protein